MLIAQWCLPLRRQQAGSPEPALSPAASNGAQRGRKNTASNKMDKIRRNTLIEALLFAYRNMRANKGQTFPNMPPKCCGLRTRTLPGST
jgi:hypothetical protein